MSSSTRSRPDRSAARVAVVLVLVYAAQWLGLSGAAAAVPLPIVGVLSGPEQTSLVIDVRAGANPVTTDQVSVTVRDRKLRAAVKPVWSSQLAVALVIDASTAGAPALPGSLSAGARFVLEAPAESRVAVIADSTPPAVVSPLRRAPLETVRALSAVQARGERSTTDALTVAIRQLPATLADPRVIVLYTSSPDAGGVPAAALAERLTQGNVILVVVGPAREDDAYWSGVSRTTGGFVAPFLAPRVAPAPDQVWATLRTRYLLTFPTPAQLPADVAVRIDMGETTLTGNAVVPAGTVAVRPPAADAPGTEIGTVLWGIVAYGVAAVGLLVFVIAARAKGENEASGATGTEPGTGAAQPPAARGRSPVPEAPPTQRRPSPP